MLEDYLNQRDRNSAAATHQAKRDGPPNHESPADLIDELLAEVGRRFYRGRGAQRWAFDEKPLKLALTWPASWLQLRAVSLPVARYREIMRLIIDGIETHGDLAKIEYFPGYFLQCIRLWWVHNGEGVYERQKSHPERPHRGFPETRRRPGSGRAGPD